MPVDEIEYMETRTRAVIRYHYHKRPRWLLGFVGRCYSGEIIGTATYSAIDSMVGSLREIGAKVEVEYLGLAD